MAQTVTYEGKTYTRVKGRWVDERYMTVSHLQKTLDDILFAQSNTEDLSLTELMQEADRFKDAGSFYFAARYYETVLQTPNAEICRYIYPRLSSCYRAMHQPEKAVALYEEARKQYGEIVMSKALCTSAAAAYCDLKDYETARRLADKAYALSGGNAIGELAAVYGRIRKETTGSGAYDG